MFNLFAAAASHIGAELKMGDGGFAAAAAAVVAAVVLALKQISAKIV